jgi:hypothetical protein
MTNEVSLILLPTGTAEVLPPMLIQHKGVWRYMSAPAAGELQLGVAQLQKMVNDRLNEAMNELPVSWKPIEGACQILYNAVVPADAQNILAEVGQGGSSVLRVHTRRHHDWIPWEIMFDGSSYLGLNFQIARLPIVDTPLALSHDQVHTVRRIRNLLGQEVLDGHTPGLEEAWEVTFDGFVPPAVEFSRLPQVNTPQAAWPTADDVGDVQQYDIIHITCHGNVKNNDGETVWALKLHGAAPTRHHINYVWMGSLNLMPTRPLVFGNACGSAEAGPQSSLSPVFGRDFFAKGAQNFIGSFGPLSKRLALDFAREFYRRLLLDEGLPIGEALLATKQHYHAQLVRDDPCYLFYCLYGPPGTRFACAE